MAVNLILIRHGQTDFNLQQRYSGLLDVGLNHTGRSQARQLGRVFQKKTAQKIYSSDRRRALETAKIIFGARKIEIVPELQEMHFGIFEGLTVKETERKFPAIYRQWLDKPFETRIPEAENLNTFRKRVLEALEKIIYSNKGKTVAVVCHGGVIGIFISHILKSQDFWGHIPASAGFVWVKLPLS